MNDSNCEKARRLRDEGSTLQVLHRLPEAGSAFRRALALDPSLVQPYMNLGRLLELQGLAREALELYVQARSRGLDRPLFEHQIVSADPAVIRAEAGVPLAGRLCLVQAG